MNKVLIALLLTKALMLQTCTGFDDKNRENLFILNANRKKVNSFVSQQLDSSSRLTCLHRCKLYKECKSINFNTETKRCELLRVVTSKTKNFESSSANDWENINPVSIFKSDFPFFGRFSYKI